MNEELESKIEGEIANCNSDALRELWLQYLSEKNEKMEQFINDCQTKNRVKGAVIGAFIGSLLD